MLFIRSFTITSARFSEFDDGNMILFQIKVFGRNIKETALVSSLNIIMHLFLMWTSLQILAKKFGTYYIFRYTLTPISVRYYWNVTAWNVSLWTQGNILLIRQNDFSLTYVQLLYYLTRKALKSNCQIYNICVFLQKETSRCRDPIFLVSSLTQKNSRKLKLHAFLHSHARKHMVSSFGLKWTESTKKFAFVPLVCP